MNVADRRHVRRYLPRYAASVVSSKLTPVLDTTRGCPAQGMDIALLKLEGSGVNAKTTQVGSG